MEEIPAHEKKASYIPQLRKMLKVADRKRFDAENVYKKAQKELDSFQAKKR